MADQLGVLADRVLATLEGTGPHIVGVSGAVAVGKSTVAARLAEDVAERGRRVHVVATDAFLYPNAILHERGLSLRKGFPETYDFDAMMRFLTAIRAGAPRVEVPVYSHAAYDIVADEWTTIENADVVLLEGVVALQPPVVDALDASIYVDADESHVRGWFVTRFLALTEAAKRDQSSFYRIFAGMTPDEVRRIAEDTWESINGVNLREHIAPSRERATFVVEKSSDHSVKRVVGPAI